MVDKRTLKFFDQDTFVDHTMNIEIDAELIEENKFLFIPDPDQSKLSPQLRDAILLAAHTHTLEKETKFFEPKIQYKLKITKKQKKT